MNDEPIILTATDQLILESYKVLLDGLSAYLGKGYELVLHSLADVDCSVIKIINGYHTGREEGAPITDPALMILREIKQSNEDGYVCYFTKNQHGEQLKSTTISIKGEGGRIIGMLCINFYLNTSFYDIVTAFSPHFSESNLIRKSENFVTGTDELIRTSVLQTRDEVMDNPLIQTNNKNREIIARLNEQGIFRMKDGVLKTANILCISRNTVYLHLRNLNES